MVQFAKSLMLAATWFMAAGAAAQGYPSKPVRVIVPFSAGGATDIVARLTGQKLGEIWGQQVVVDNRPGAGGNIGGELVARAAPDGYTLFMTSGSIVTANQHIYKKMPFDPVKDLMAVTNVASGPQVLVVTPTFPPKTVRELIALAKARPRDITFASAGFGTQTHLAAENFIHAARIEVVHIPYKGEAPAITDVMGGQVLFATPNLAAALNFIQQKKLRALGVQQATLAAIARCSGDCGNAAGIRKSRLVRVHGAGRYAARGHRQDIPRHCQGARFGRHEEPLRRPRHGPGRQQPGRACRGDA
jgi:tripartite-type tricarboxylate transporter receptor subunit TctC